MRARRDQLRPDGNRSGARDGQQRGGRRDPTDFSKLGTNSRISFCEPARIGTLVTDAKAESVDSYKGLKKVIKHVVLA